MVVAVFAPRRIGVDDKHKTFTTCFPESYLHVVEPWPNCTLLTPTLILSSSSVMSLEPRRVTNRQGSGCDGGHGWGREALDCDEVCTLSLLSLFASSQDLLCKASNKRRWDAGICRLDPPPLLSPFELWILDHPDPTLRRLPSTHGPPYCLVTIPLSAVSLVIPAKRIGPYPLDHQLEDGRRLEGGVVQVGHHADIRVVPMLYLKTLRHSAGPLARRSVSPRPATPLPSSDRALLESSIRLNTCHMDLGWVIGMEAEQEEDGEGRGDGAEQVSDWIRGFNQPLSTSFMRRVQRLRGFLSIAIIAPRRQPVHLPPTPFSVLSSIPLLLHAPPGIDVVGFES
ncbi:hypothetical protein ONZ45_g11135 [Pleurotus djamor]|nr:hypothetical protein ONZ45_g11135 [Pleurotus djamor]